MFVTVTPWFITSLSRLLSIYLPGLYRTSRRPRADFKLLYSVVRMNIDVNDYDLLSTF